MRMVSLGEGQLLPMKTGTGYLRAGAQKGIIHAKGSVTQHLRMLRLVPSSGMCRNNLGYSGDAAHSGDVWQEGKSY